MKYTITLLLIFIIYQAAYGQADSIKVRAINSDVTEHCRFEMKENKFYYEYIGATYAYIALAKGWFKSNGGCSYETYLSEIIERKLYLSKDISLIKYKNGKPFSGSINESDGRYTLIGRCKKGKLHGKLKVLDNHENMEWTGVMKNGLLQKNE